MQMNSLVSDFLRSNTDDAGEQLRIIKQISGLITDKTTSLLRLVADLGDYLVVDNASMRSKAMRLLEGVLARLPLESLSGQHVTVMVQFFCDRTTDEVCMMESLAALSTLSQMKFFAKQDAEQVITNVIQIATSVNKLPQRTRFQLYSLLDKLMATRRQHMKQFSSQLLEAFSSLMSGEKDPRNLMLAFSILRIMLQEFEIHENRIADLFDSVYCYFPITFRPQSDEPLTITTEDLKTRLRKCLSANSKFAPYLIPALIEKLNAVAASVKKDTLLTLIDCAENFEAIIFDPYTSQLWPALKFEIIQSEDDLLEEVVLDALRAITRCLASGLDDMPRSGSLSRWLQPIITEASLELREPDLKSARPCGKILYSIAMSSKVSLSVVCQAMLPILIALCHESDAADKKATLLGVVSHLIRANVEVEKRPGRSTSPSSSCLTPAVPELMQLLIPAIATPEQCNVQVQHVSIDCLQNLVISRNLVNDHDITRITQYLTSMLMQKSLENQSSVLTGLGQIAKIKSHLIIDQAFPILLAALPDYSKVEDTTQTDRILQCLSTLATEKMIFDCLIIRILSRLETCIASESPSVRYIMSLLSTIRGGLDHFDGMQDQFYDTLITKLCSMVLQYPYTQFTDPAVLKIINEITNVVIRSSSVEKQIQISGALFSRKSNALEGQSISEQALSIESLGAYLEDGLKANIDTVLVATLISLRREVEVVKTLDHQLLKTSVRILNRSENAFLQNSLQVLIASLLNKCRLDSDVSLFLASISTTLEVISRENLHLITWIAKSLILRGHKQAIEIIYRMIDSLASQELGGFVARCFGTLLEPHDALTKMNHANIRALYKQKLYNLAVPRLIEALRSAPVGMHPPYLQALSTIIANTPKAIYIADLTNIYPILLQCIALPAAHLKYSAITTLHAIGAEGRDITGSHLATLVPSLLSCTQQSDFSTPQVRIASLRLLGTLVELLRADKMQPYKVRIIRALGNVLDDKKRHVRKEAVLTRQKYYLVL